ncbi:hypothetical protein SALBM311S_08110 [Streptomyces alboniger]
MHQCGREPWHRVQQGVLCLHGDGVRLTYRRLAVHDDRHLGAQPVPDPPQPQLAHAAHPFDLPYCPLGPVDQGRIDGVQHAPEHLARSVPQDQGDRGGDRQPHDRVGQLPAQRGAPAPNSTARDVNPSVRACSPSATRAAEPMERPTRIR